MMLYLNERKSSLDSIIVLHNRKQKSLINNGINQFDKTESKPIKIINKDSI